MLYIVHKSSNKIMNDKLFNQLVVACEFYGVVPSRNGSIWMGQTHLAVVSHSSGLWSIDIYGYKMSVLHAGEDSIYYLLAMMMKYHYPNRKIKRVPVKVDGLFVGALVAATIVCLSLWLVPSPSVRVQPSNVTVQNQ
jgi:hypothetical protein